MSQKTSKEGEGAPLLSESPENLILQQEVWLCVQFLWVLWGEDFKPMLRLEMLMTCDLPSHNPLPVLSKNTENCLVSGTYSISCYKTRLELDRWYPLLCLACLCYTHADLVTKVCLNRHQGSQACPPSSPVFSQPLLLWLVHVSWISQFSELRLALNRCTTERFHWNICLHATEMRMFSFLLVFFSEQPE